MSLRSGMRQRSEPKIRSPSRSNDVSDLIGHLDARELQLAPAGVSAGDQGIGAPRALLECFVDRSMMSDQPCRLKRPVRLVLELDQTDPFVGVSSTDLRPGQRLRHRRRDLLCRAHRPMVDRFALVSSSWPRDAAGSTGRVAQARRGVRCQSSGSAASPPPSPGSPGPPGPPEAGGAGFATSRTWRTRAGR